MSRRRMMIALGASVLIAPLRTLAQTRKVWRIGYLGREMALHGPRIDAFKAGMGALGYREGRDYAIDLRGAQPDQARVTELAKQLAASKVDLILTSTTP